jgi:hypothetical protein
MNTGPTPDLSLRVGGELDSPRVTPSPPSLARDENSPDSNASQHASTSTKPSTSSSPWIISRAQDLLWFQGSVLAGVALLAVFALTPLNDASYTVTHPAVLALFLWGVLFDGTHVFGTYARTYLAPDAESRAALPGHWSWLLIGVGPLIAVVDRLFFAPSASVLASAGLLFRSFLMVAYLWAYWHLVRQHYGFLALYRRKDPRADALQGHVEVALLWLGSLYPYLRFSLSDAYAHSGLPVLTPAPLVEPSRMLLDISAAVGGLVLVGMLLWRSHGRLGPRHLFLALVIGFHLLVFGVLHNLLTITATLTIFHNLQYHRIVWRYEAGHGRVPFKSVGRYLAFGVGLGLIWYGPRILGVASTQSDLMRNILLGLGWGVAFHHYLVDGRIWKVRRSPSVARALSVGATS